MRRRQSRNTRASQFREADSPKANARLNPSATSVKAIALLACMLLSAATGLGGQSQISEAQAHANAGLHFAKEGDLQAAERELRRAVELGPRDEAFLADLGTILAMQKRFDESSTFFQRALELDPRDIAARRYLAANQWQLQRFSEAKQNLSVLLEEKPGDEQAMLLLGMVCENMKDYAGATRALAAVPGLVRERPESIAALARSYYHLGKREKARDILGELAPETAGGRGVFLGAEIADQMHDYATAEKMLRQIESTYPDPVELSYKLALVQYHAQEFLSAKKTLDQLTESGQKMPQIYNLLGWCDQELHQGDEARAAMEQAIVLEPGNESNSLDLVKILLAQRRFSAALDMATRTADAFPSSARASSLKGSVELKMERYADSVRSYAEAVKLDPSDPEGLLGLAAAQSAGSRNDQAATTLGEGRQNFPKDARFPLEEGLLEMKKRSGDPLAESHAERMFKLALTLDSSLPEAHYQLGNLALERGQLTEAVSQLKAAERLSPDEAKIHFALSRAYRRLNQKEDAAAEMAVFDRLKNAAISAPASSMGAPQD